MAEHAGYHAGHAGDGLEEDEPDELMRALVSDAGGEIAVIGRTHCASVNGLEAAVAVVECFMSTC